MNQAVVFFDIDDTLRSDKTGAVPQSAVESIKKLAQNGHIPVINTGRPFGHVLPAIKSLAARGFVCGCGLYVRLDDTVIRNYRIDRELCLKMRDLVISCKLDGHFESIDTSFLYINFTEDYFPGQSGRAYLSEAGVNIREDIYADDFRFDKFVVWHNEDSDFERFKEEAGKYFSIIYRTNDFTELVPNGYSKGEGILKFLLSLPEGKRTVYAFGDSTNDIDMFHIADVSILMGNGNMELRDMVDYITTPVDDDGIKNALEHFGLI